MFEIPRYDDKPAARPAPIRGADDMEFMWNCVSRPIGRFIEAGRFQGAFAGYPEFTCQTMPEGIEVAGSEGRQASAILAENVCCVSVAGGTPANWALVTVGTFCKHAFSAEPDWEPWDEGDGGMKGILRPEGSKGYFEFRTDLRRDIDPVWNGQKLGGAALFIEVKTSS